MKENEKRIQIIMEDQSYLAQSLEDTFDNAGLIADSGIILRKIKTLLEDSYDIVLANSGAMAIKYLALRKPDLILLDYEMPIVNGGQVMQMIREDNDFKDIPIIFLTGKNDVDTVSNVMSLKPDGYLLKNTEPKKLHQAIDDFFTNIEKGD